MCRIDRRMPSAGRLQINVILLKIHLASSNATPRARYFLKTYIGKYWQEKGGAVSGTIQMAADADDAILE